MTKIKNVLIIDDDDINNFLCSKVIKISGFAENVVTCQSAREGLNYFQELIDTDSEQLPDIVFLDINMPLMNGWDFLNEYEKLDQKIKKDIPIYMLSSSVYNNDIQKAQNHKYVTDYISKPLTEEILAEIGHN